MGFVDGDLGYLLTWWFSGEGHISSRVKASTTYCQKTVPHKKKKKKNPGVIATHNDQVIANIHCFRSSSTNLPTLGRYLGLRKGLRMVTVSSKHVSFVTRRPSWIETVSCHFRYLSSVSANHEGSSNPARNMETASSATHLRGGGGNHATSTIPMMDGCD